MDSFNKKSVHSTPSITYSRISYYIPTYIQFLFSSRNLPGVDSYKREVGRKLCSFNANSSLWWYIGIMYAIVSILRCGVVMLISWLVDFQVIVVFVAFASGVSSVPVPQQYNDIHHDQQQYRTSPVPILKHNYQQLNGGYQYR